MIPFDDLNSQTSPHISTLVDLLRYRSVHQPNKLAFTFLLDGEAESDSLTYQQLDSKARAIAAELQRPDLTAQRYNIEDVLRFLETLLRYRGIKTVK